MTKTFLDTLSSRVASAPKGPYGIHALSGPSLRLLVVPSEPCDDQDNLAQFINAASTHFAKLIEVAQLTRALLRTVKQEDDGKFTVEALALSQVHHALTELECGA